MKIQMFAYRDTANGWYLEPVQLGDLNLLVGVSGVGKTKSLQAMFALNAIANGRSANGVEWDIMFEDEGDRNCRWAGKFTNLGLERKVRDYFMRGEDERDVVLESPRLLSEALIVDGKDIVKRTAESIVFKGQPTLKLSPSESAVKLLKEEADIAPVYESLSRIVWNKDFREGKIVDFDRALEQYPSLTDIQNSKLDIFLKLSLLSQCEPQVFTTIKQGFMAIFPYVEDMRVAPIHQDDLPILIAQFPFVQFKEKHIERWIYPWELSNGMLKALSVIGDLYLLPPGSVLLIDELENSLGVNCIDAVGDLLSEKRDLQLILTSHHPYIINTIDMAHWKILTRRGGVVKVSRAEDFERLSKRSLHDNFTRLLDIEEIIQGVAET